MAETAPKRPSEALIHLDLFRGISALVVLVAHLRGICFEAGAKHAHASLGMKLAYFVTGCGHQAVIFFFVLSGFFIGTSVIESMAKDRWSWRHFLLRRFTRLWVVLVPVLLVTTIIDASGMRLFGADGNIYGGKFIGEFSTADARQSLSVPVFFGNLFFVQEMVTTIYGTNGALWSLGYEFWCYLIFPLGFLLLGRRRTALTRGLALIGLAAIAVLGKDQLAWYFGCWLFGAAVAAIWRRVAERWAASELVLVGVSLVFVGTTAFARAFAAWKGCDYVLAVATGAFVLVLLVRSQQGRSKPVSERYRRFATELAGFSYTLYVVHFPIIAFFSAGWVGGERWAPTLSHAAMMVPLGLGIVVFAYVLARLTERHTDAVRSWIERRLA